MKTNEWQDWYLTDDGWARGSHKDDFIGTVKMSPPEKWYLTGRWVEQGYGSKIERLVIGRELGANVDMETVNSLIKKHGDVPNHL